MMVNGKRIAAHRLAWILTHGDIAEDILVCHHCDVRLCVNPSHLFLGTHADNSQDMVNKHRQTSGEKNARAALTAEQVLAIRAASVNFESQSHIASRFGINQQTVSKIVNRTRWNHV